MAQTYDGEAPSNRFALGSQIISSNAGLLTPLLDLGIRVFIFWIFFLSGWKKVTDFDSAVFLYEYEWTLGILPPEGWAYLAILFEVGASSLVLIGLFARHAAIPLLGMAIIIQFWLGGINATYFRLEHFAWMLLLASVIVRGPGPLSLDRFISPRLASNDDTNGL